MFPDLTFYVNAPLGNPETDSYKRVRGTLAQIGKPIWEGNELKLAVSPDSYAKLKTLTDAQLSATLKSYGISDSAIATAIIRKNILVEYLGQLQEVFAGTREIIKISKPGFEFSQNPLLQNNA